MNTKKLYVEMDEFEKEMVEAMFVEDEYLCNKCFRRPEECRCESERVFVEIDDPLIKTIQNLNDKGVKTSFCCSGHPAKQMFYNYSYDEVYIAFADEKPAGLDIPEGFVFEELKHNPWSKWTLRCRYNFKTVEEGLEKRHKIIDVMEKWSEEIIK